MSKLTPDEIVKEWYNTRAQAYKDAEMLLQCSAWTMKFLETFHKDTNVISITEKTPVHPKTLYPDAEMRSLEFIGKDIHNSIKKLNSLTDDLKDALSCLNGN